MDLLTFLCACVLTALIIIIVLGAWALRRIDCCLRMSTAALASLEFMALEESDVGGPDRQAIREHVAVTLDAMAKLRKERLL